MEVDVHHDRIARYKAAYQLLNGAPIAATIVYERGWYRFRNAWRETGRYRAAKLEEMIARLQWLASNHRPQIPARGMSPGTAETLQGAQGEAGQPGPKDAPNSSSPSPSTPEIPQ